MMRKQAYNDNVSIKRQLKIMLGTAILSPALWYSAFAADGFTPQQTANDSGITIQDFSLVTDAMLQNPDPADWLMWRRTLNIWGHSPLDQVNSENVNELRIAWTRGLTDGIMFFPNPLDVIQAIDIRTGDMIWEYRRRIPDDISEYFPTPDMNRNRAICDELIIDTSVDNYIFVLNARTGELVWETQILDYRRSAQQTSGPIMANGMAFQAEAMNLKAAQMPVL